MKQHFELMGHRVRDAVTGFVGVVETISFDLYGCIQCVVKPGLDEKGQVQDGKWFDLKRLIRVSDEPVMAQPTFELVPGGAEKPSQASQPMR